MVDLKSVLDNAVGRVGSALPELHLHTDFFLVVEFRGRHPSIELFKSTFVNGDLSPFEAGDHSLVFRCKNYHNAIVVGTHIQKVLGKFNDELLSQPFSETWLSEYQAHYNLGVWTWYPLQMEVRRKGDEDLVREKITDNEEVAQAADRAIESDLLMMSTHDAVELWTQRILQDLADKRWEDFIRTRLLEVANIGIAVDNRHKLIVSDQIEPILSAIPRKMIALGGTQAVASASSELEKADAWISTHDASSENMRPLVDEFFYIRKIIEELNSELGDEDGALHALDPESIIRPIQPLAMNDIVQLDNDGVLIATPAGELMQAFLYHITMLRIAKRTSHVRDRLQVLSKSLNPASNISGTVEMLKAFS